MRKIGINTRSTSGITDERYVELIAELGFDSAFSDIHFGREDLHKISDLLAKKGIAHEYLHSDFSHINDIWLDTLDGEAMFKKLIDDIDCTEEIGVPISIIHLSSGNNPPPITDIGRARYTKLVDHAAQKNVSIAFENLRKLANVAWAFEAFEDAENVGFCWDCGHENCYTKSIEFMPLFGKKLISTHIHDNSGIQDSDDHVLPFDGSLNFSRFAEHIRNSGYTGTLMLEVFRSPDFYKNVDPEAFIIKAADSIKKLRTMVDGE